MTLVQATAKFRVSQVSGTPPDQTVRLEAVSGGEESQSLWHGDPEGRMDIRVTNAEANHLFSQGKDIIATFTPA